MADDFFNDLASAVHRLRSVFIKHNLAPPVAIELGSIDAGKRLQLSVPKDMILPRFGLNQRDKSGPAPDVIIPFLGIEFRYPAELRNRRSGQIDFDDGVSGRAFYGLDGTRIR